MPDWLTWSRWDWTLWELHHPWSLLIPGTILGIYLLAKLRNR